MSRNMASQPRNPRVVVGQTDEGVLWQIAPFEVMREQLVGVIGVELS